MLCVGLHTVRKITQGSLSRSIWKNSPHLKFFTLTLWLAWLTIIRYVAKLYTFVQICCSVGDWWQCGSWSSLWLTGQRPTLYTGHSAHHSIYSSLQPIILYWPLYTAHPSIDWTQTFLPVCKNPTIYFIPNSSWSMYDPKAKSGFDHLGMLFGAIRGWIKTLQLCKSPFSVFFR